MLNDGIIKFLHNTIVTAVLVKRGVMDLSKHVERSDFGNLQINTNGYALIAQSLRTMIDYGMVIRLNNRGVYQITNYGRSVCTAWFDINSDM